MPDLNLTKLREEIVDVIEVYSWDGQGYANEIADLLISGPLAALLEGSER